MPSPAREYLCSARDAAREIAEYAARIERERGKCGIRARNPESSSHGSVLDAMRHVDRVVDMEEAAPRELRDARAAVADALEVVAGVGVLGLPKWADVLEDRFIRRMTWPEVGEANGMAARDAEEASDAAIDWMDSQGIARLREWRFAVDPGEIAGGDLKSWLRANRRL